MLIPFILNSKEVSVDVPAYFNLSDVLRDDFGQILIDIHGVNIPAEFGGNMFLLIEEIGDGLFTNVNRVT